MKSRCNYGCWFGGKCLGITREEMVEKLMGLYEDETLYAQTFPLLSSEELQKIADDHADIDYNLGHIIDNPKGGNQ